jgi:hypothetical protein
VYETNKTELNTLDEADFVRDVDKSSSHQLSQDEIAGDNPCSRHLSGKYDAKRGNHFLQADFSGLIRGVEPGYLPGC